MEDTNQAPVASEQEPVETAPEIAEVETEATSETEDQVDWKSEAVKAKELAHNYKIRAEKAEKLAKAEKPKEQKPQAQQELSISDAIALLNAKVPEEDFQEVSDYARLKGISVREAVKSPVVKAILGQNEERRKVALATSVNSPRRGANKVSDETILERAQRNQLPESDEEMERLAAARMAAKKKR